MLTRLMRDRGIDYYWDDIYCENLFAQGFEASQAKQPYAALTAFEALEHIEDPLNFVSSCLAKYQCRTIIFTTELFRGNEAPKNDWWYYSFPTGQHISFFNLKTLEKLANELQLKFYSISGLHIFTDRSLNFLPFLALLTRSNIAPLIAILVKKRLGSRTQADSQMLLKISR
jgi:hypothetical protein